MEAQPLSAEDRAILALERGAIVGHTCKVIVLGEGAPSAQALRARIEDRLDQAPALKRCLDDDPQMPSWVPVEDLDLTKHVVAPDSPTPLDRRGMRDEVARLFSERLDRTRPLWRMDVLPLEGG